jgi:hypothetical protein
MFDAACVPWACVEHQAWKAASHALFLLLRGKLC